MLQYFIDNAPTLILACCVIISAITGKPLTPEKIELKKVKRERKLIKKGAKISSKLESISDELQGGEK